MTGMVVYVHVLRGVFLANHARDESADSEEGRQKRRPDGTPGVSKSVVWPCFFFAAVHAAMVGCCQLDPRNQCLRYSIESN